MMPKGFYIRSKKYCQDMSTRMKEVMNSPSVKAHQKNMALKRWEKERALSVEKIEPKEDEAMVIAKDFVNNEISNKDHARIILKSLESANNKEEAVREVEDDFDSQTIEDLKRMADELEGQFSLLGLTDICRQVFQLSLHAERTVGYREKYLTTLRELGKKRGKLEEAKRKRRGS